MQKITKFEEEDVTIYMFINFNQGCSNNKGYVHVPCYNPNDLFFSVVNL